VVIQVRSRNKSLDPKEIAKEILNGSSFDQVQQKYGIKMRSQLLSLYSRGLALLEVGPAPNTPSPPAPNSSAPPPVRSHARRVIGTSGTITLTRSLLIDELGFGEGDRFSVARQGDKIILERLQS
jgi:hypothetical protein